MILSIETSLLLYFISYITFLIKLKIDMHIGENVEDTKIKNGRREKKITHNPLAIVDI